MQQQGRSGGRQEFCGSSSSRDAHQAAPSSANDMPSLPFVHGTTNYFLESHNASGFGWVPHHPIPMRMLAVTNPHVQTMFYPQGSLGASSSIIHPFVQPGSSTQFVPLMPVIHHPLQFTPDWYVRAQTFTQHLLNLSYQQQRMGQFIQQIEEHNRGLSQEVISKNIKREKFELIGQVTSENKEVCVICQEDFITGEEIGKLNYCVHKFHICCITQWLAEKNVCPICKRTGLCL